MQILFMKDRLPRLKNPSTLTVPHEFHLRTDERAHTHQGDQSKVCLKCRYASVFMLMCCYHRGDVSCSSFYYLGFTHWFSTIVQSSPFISMAERIRRFHTRTPERYHVPGQNSEFQVKYYSSAYRAKSVSSFKREDIRQISGVLFMVTVIVAEVFGNWIASPKGNMISEQAKEHQHAKELKLTRARSPAFETSLRARPPRFVTSDQLFCLHLNNMILWLPFQSFLKTVSRHGCLTCQSKSTCVYIYFIIWRQNLSGCWCFHRCQKQLFICKENTSSYVSSSQD